jgi:hypothetical protein
VLKQLKKLLFTDEFKPTHPPIVCPEHEYLLRRSLYPSPAQIPMVCSKVNTNLEDPDELEDLRYLNFKGSESTRDVKDIILDDANSLIPNP